MYVCTYVCMYVWVDVWIDGWMSTYMCSTSWTTALCTTSALGDPMTLNFNVSLGSNFPLDVYFLMDFSSTMSRELTTLGRLADQVCKYYSGEWICAAVVFVWLFLQVGIVMYVYHSFVAVSELGSLSTYVNVFHCSWYYQKHHIQFPTWIWILCWETNSPVCSNWYWELRVCKSRVCTLQIRMYILL